MSRGCGACFLSAAPSRLCDPASFGFIYLFVCLSVCLSVCLFVGASVHSNGAMHLCTHDASVHTRTRTHTRARASTCARTHNMIVQSISGPYLDAHSDTTTHAMAAIRICFWITLPCTPPDYAYPIHSPNRWTQTINPMHALLHPALCHEAGQFQCRFGSGEPSQSRYPIGADVGQGELIRGTLG